VTEQAEKKPPESSSLTYRRILTVWWPLAASWLLMALELPALSAVLTRLPDAQIQLAAWGGVIFPICLIVEAPIIMLLAASTALSKDWVSYRKLHRFMITSSLLLTGLHILITFTPLYYFVVGTLIGAPAEVIEPARPGLMFMTVWTGAIAFRRLNQGLLIRFNHSGAVGVGTIVRLSTDVAVLLVGFFSGRIPGAALAGLAVGSGVVAEAVYTGLRVRPVVRDELREAPVLDPPLNLRVFIDFYLPLALTSVLNLLIQPLGSAALSRMPEALGSLALWPVVSGFVFILRSPGVAYNEVVVALLKDNQSYRRLGRFALIMAAAVTVLLMLVSATPVGRLWFQTISGLSPDLAQTAQLAVWFALPLPALNVVVSFLQGVLVNSRKTRGITESMAIFLLAAVFLLVAGIILQRWMGLYLAWVAFSVGMMLQTAWLWYRTRNQPYTLRS